MIFIFHNFALKTCGLAENQCEGSLYLLPSKFGTNIILNNSSKPPTFDHVRVEKRISQTDGYWVVFNDCLKLGSIELCLHHEIVYFWY